MNKAILLNQLIGKNIKVYLKGGLVLKGTLDKLYYGEDFRGKFYSFAIKGENGTIREFATINVIGWDIL